MRPTTKLTEGPVSRRLIGLAVPMLGGTFAMTAFNLADTYFVSRLGTRPLAAMGFTFPVVMFVACIGRGLGMGTTSVVSRIIGAGDHEQAKRVTTHSFILAAIVVGALSVVGICTIDPVFRMLGATDDVLPMIRQFMVIWYAGVVFMVLPMMANDVLRAAGDTVSPSLIMVVGSVLNAVLDPIMIFGLLGCARMELRGAALATVLTRALTLVGALWIVHARHRLIHVCIPSRAAMWASWRRVLHIGIPAAGTNLLMPISAAIITRLVAGFGEPAVAACGAGARIEMFAFMIPMALGVSQVPFIGQNWGAGRLDRVNQCRLYSNWFAFVWGIGAAAAFVLASGRLAACFSDDERVVRVLAQYLSIVPIGYGMMEVHRYVGFSFNAVGQPMNATAVNVVRVVILLVPCSYLGAYWLGLPGVFWGRVAADVGSASVALLWARRVFRSLGEDAPR